MRLFHTTVVAVMLSLMPGCARKPAPAPASLFPESNEVPGWSRSGETRSFEAARLWEYIDGGAEKYIQAGVEKTLTTDYRYQGKIEAAADIYVMRAAEGAKKIFESEPATDSQPVQVGDAALLRAQSLTFRKGRYFVRLVAYEDAPQVGQALAGLARAINRRFAQEQTK